jgi:MoaA/NifB/PqqE/SkfB family radical SAM enzyme
MPPCPESTIHLHLDVAERHPGSDRLAFVAGRAWAEGGERVLGIGLSNGAGGFVECPFPFHRGDADGGVGGMTGFCAVLPREAGVAGPAGFAVFLSDGACHRVPAPQQGCGAVVRADAASRLDPAPCMDRPGPARVGELVEQRLLAGLARERRLTLRLDLINKCNLRCVMCHYSDPEVALRPAQRISPAQFDSFFEPLAPMVRDVVLSCGDEPLMSPHFEEIVRTLAARAPRVRISFCTNAMLMGGRAVRAIVESGVATVMLSFDGVTSSTLHRIRVGSDYRRIVGNILGLRDARGSSARPRLVFNFVMLASNLHEAPAFVRMARELGGDAIDFRHVVPSDTYDISAEMLERTPARYNHYRARVVAEGAACGMDLYIPPPFPDAGAHDPSTDPVASLDEFHAVMAEAGFSPRGAAPREQPAPPAQGRPTEASFCFCDRPFSEVMIRDQREAYPCAWHTEPMGDARGPGTLDGIFLGERFAALRLAMLDPLGAPGCRNCPIKAGRLPTLMLPSGTEARQ